MDIDRASDIVTVVDTLLVAFFAGNHTMMLIEPADGGQTLSFEPSKTSFTFAPMLGDAIAARLIFIAGLELPTKNQQFGKMKIRIDLEEEEILVGARMSSLGLAVEVWRKSTSKNQGSRFSLYEIHEPLGKGGFGVVYRATYKPLQRAVALKILHDSIAQDQVHRERFLREALLASRVRHPGLVDVLDFGVMPEGRAFLVMEFVQGTPLRSLLLLHGVLAPALVLSICLQLARALSTLHAAGLVHRDIKPENIYVGPDNWVKLGDFGSTKEIRPQDPSLTQTGMIFGTPPYMSPENIQGFEIDHRADLYSVGCLFYELLTGAPPFTGRTSHEIFTAHLNEPTPALGDDIPELFQGILDGLLEKSPENRYNNASLLISDLERAQDIMARSGSRHWRK